jgi:hypothetical protein
MSATTDQLAKLARLVADTRPEEPDCEAFLDLLAGYLEASQGQRWPLSPDYAAVERHLRVCANGGEEFRALLHACGQ